LKKILITGGAGFFGSHLVELFLKNKYHVNVIDNFSNGKNNNIKKFLNNKRLKVFKSSIGNKKALTRSINGCEGIIHCATKNLRFSLKNPLETDETNTSFTLLLLEEAKKNKVKKFIYCSSSEVYGNLDVKHKLKEKEHFNPTTIYGASKLAGEYYAKVYRDLYKLNLIILRPFNMYGERANIKGNSAEVITRFFLNLMSSKKVYIYGDGKNSRDFSYVKDIANIFLKIYQRQGKFKTELLNLGFGKDYSVNKILNHISKILNIKYTKAKYLPERPGDVKRLICNNSKIKKIYNLNPNIKLIDGLIKYYKWIKHKKNLPSIKPKNW